MSGSNVVVSGALKPAEVAQRIIPKRCLLLLAVVLVGAALRVYYAGIGSLGIDEVFSVWIAKLSLPQIAQNTAADVHPPLYYAALHYWIMLNGDSEFTVRLLSVIFGVLAISAAYLLGRLLYGETVGLLTALILAIAAFNVQFSQVARMYSLMLLLTLLSMYCFVGFLHERNLAISAGYVLVTILLLYTHVYGLFVVLAQNIYVATLLLLSRRNTFRISHWTALQAIVLALFAPWIGVLANQVSAVESGYWIQAPTLATLTATLVAYAATDLLLILFCLLSILAFFRYRKVTGSTNGKAPIDALEDYSWEVHTFCPATAWLLVIWQRLESFLFCGLVVLTSSHYEIDRRPAYSLLLNLMECSRIDAFYQLN